MRTQSAPYNLNIMVPDSLKSSRLIAEANCDFKSKFDQLQNSIKALS